MLKFALVGKGISHSRSPEIYQRLIQDVHGYDLIDVDNEYDLPGVNDLKAKYYGVNITSPYKEFYFTKESASEVAQKVGAVNCMRFSKGKAESTNTDYLAMTDLLMGEIKRDHWLILGGGVMSRVAKSVCEDLKIPFTQLTRREAGDLNQLDYSEYRPTNNGPLNILNTCSRDFTFCAPIHEGDTFWDLNYAHEGNKDLLKKCSYIDGYSLLYRQAEHAVQFWDV